MTKRIFRSIFGVVVIMMLAVSALVLAMMYQYASSEQLHSLKNQTQYVAAGIEESGITYLEGIKKPLDRITWIAPDGEVLFDSKADFEQMDNHKERVEVAEAFAKGEGTSQRFSKTLSEKTTNYALLLEDGSVLRISANTLSPFTLFFTLTQPLAIITVLAIALSLFLGFQTAKNITKPINTIDLENPEQAVVYEELTPLLRRIAVQNRQLHGQMRDLKRQKQQFDTITSNMQEGLLVLNGQGGVLSYNAGALRLMEIDSPKEGSNVLALNRSEGFRLCVESALRGKHREENIQINGRACQLFANPVIQDEAVAGVILLLFDVTEKEEREKLRREFTANVSHELKTPLTSISGFAEIMKNGMVKAEDIPKFAGNIYDEAQRLIRLVQDIIKLSKLDEKENTLEKTEVDLEEIVTDVVKRFLPIAKKSDVQLLAETESVKILGVEPVLNEMLSNLCDNAIRYNRPKGQVLIRLWHTENEVFLSVKDTGIGIALANQNRVFERFFRENESRSKETEGTGLGLSIVKHGAMLHEAKIEMESEPGKGTCIVVRFLLND